MPAITTGQGFMLWKPTYQDSLGRLIHVIPERSTYGDGTTHTAVTVTIGLASFPAEAADEKRLVELADERLYAGKNAGRNRIVA